ncbi:MAG TPA: c-type cytochrome [Kofleriaceae bacterium]|nr:c-type cytochrome [Kofleriaceae bacterium]
MAATAHASPHDLPGWSRYEQLCVACHGSRGDGLGPAAAYARGEPRDFTRGAFEWRTTPFGAPASDADLARTIRLGARGTSMPAFGDVLGERDIAEMIAIVRAFAPNVGTPQHAIALGVEPAATTNGAAIWARAGCASCHGDDGRGNRALASPPYDLTREPLHRPRESDAPADRRRAAAWSIATGMTGTAMPGFAQLSAADLWALADRVVELGANAHDDRMAMGSAKLAIGTWPGSDPDEATMFGSAVPPQGPPPASLAPAEASLSARQCARCHAKQAREWQPSLHAGAMSVGYRARLADGVDPTNCARCHAPLAEQRSDKPLAAESVQCAGCHVRAWTRRGPAGVAPSLVTLPDYPFTPSPIYDRADFCMTCHQLPPSSAVAGKPLLNTYKEWLEGPYMRRGIQCQSCHMPDREHTWLGVHDPATLRQAYRLDARATRDGDAIRVDVELANIGAGHDLPTTATPAIYVIVELLDGTRTVGRFAQRIGRDIYWDGSWHERSDTRIAPGESLKIARAWHGHATAARVTVEAHPDEYYEGLYASRLGANPLASSLYGAALQKARGSHYIAETREIALP